MLLADAVQVDRLLGGRYSVLVAAQFGQVALQGGERRGEAGNVSLSPDKADPSLGDRGLGIGQARDRLVLEGPQEVI